MNGKGLKEINLPEDLRRGKDLAHSLRMRRLSIEKVCKISTVGRVHFSKVLNSGRKLTFKTYKRLEPFLIMSERQIVLRGTNVSIDTDVEGFMEVQS